MNVVAFNVGHLEWLKSQPGHEHLSTIKTEYAVELQKSPYSRSIISDDGRVLCCGGLLLYWHQRGEVWAFFNQNCRREFLSIHKLALQFLRALPVNRVEASVEVDHKEGHRWCKLLGFKREAKVCRAYLPNGKDASLYARIA